MKRLFIALFAISGLAFTANAQEFGFSQGNVIVEGNIGFNSTNDKGTDAKTNSFEITPKVGYFLTDKVAIGIQLGFGTGKSENLTAVGSEVKTNNFGAGVFGRYYFLELGKRFKTYTEVGVGYGSNKTETTPATGATTITEKANGFAIGAGVGANYFLTEKIALNFQLADVIGFSSLKPDGGKAETNFGLAAGGVKNIFDEATFGLVFKF